MRCVNTAAMDAYAQCKCAPPLTEVQRHSTFNAVPRLQYATE